MGAKRRKRGATRAAKRTDKNDRFCPYSDTRTKSGRLAMRRLGYIRTSTEDQSVDRQVDQLHEACDQLFIENGVSAIAKHRPVYEALTRKLVPGDVLVVLAVDRAFRSVTDALLEISKLQRRGIGFESLSQDFDLNTPDGKLLFTIIAAMAAWERDVISMRTKQGLIAVRNNGQVLGRPRKLSPVKIARARCLLVSDTPPSLAAIARSFRVDRRTLKRALDRPVREATH